MKDQNVRFFSLSTLVLDEVLVYDTLILHTGTSLLWTPLGWLKIPSFNLDILLGVMIYCTFLYVLVVHSVLIKGDVSNILLDVHVHVYKS